MISRRQSLAVSIFGTIVALVSPIVQAFAAESDNEIYAVTEESILAFMENGKPAGPAVELVKATLEKSRV